MGFSVSASSPGAEGSVQFDEVPGMEAPSALGGPSTPHALRTEGDRHAGRSATL